MADIFGRRNDNSPRQEAGIFARYLHAASQVRGRPRITVPQALDQGTGRVEVFVPRDVVLNGLLLDRFLRDLQIEYGSRSGQRQDSDLQAREGQPSIAVTNNGGISSARTAGQRFPAVREC